MDYNAYNGFSYHSIFHLTWSISSVARFLFIWKFFWLSFKMLLNLRWTGQCSDILLKFYNTFINSHLLVYKSFLTSFIPFKLLYIAPKHTKTLSTDLLQTNKDKCERLWETESGIRSMLNHCHWYWYTEAWTNIKTVSKEAARESNGTRLEQHRDWWCSVTEKAHSLC